MKKFIIVLTIITFSVLSLYSAERAGEKVIRVKHATFGNYRSVYSHGPSEVSKGNLPPGVDPYDWLKYHERKLEKEVFWVYTTGEIDSAFSGRDKNIAANNKGMEENKKKLAELEKSTKDLISNSSLTVLAYLSL